MKILFAGSPPASAQILERLIADGMELVGVISQPDKRSKRGGDKEPSAVSLAAQKYGIKTFKPDTLGEAFQNELLQFACDFLIVSAYGKILPSWMLLHPKIAPINIHYSLLPKYRGASPIQSVFLGGESKTGISIMKMTEGLDEGPVYNSHEISIDDSDDRFSLEQKLVDATNSILSRELNSILTGHAIAVEQTNKDATFCSKVTKDSGEINLSTVSAHEMLRKFKAYSGWPGIYFDLKNTKIKIHGLAMIPLDGSHIFTGLFKFIDGNLAINLPIEALKNNDKLIVITYLQLPNKTIISAHDAANSYRDFFET